MSEQNPAPVVVAVGHEPIDAALSLGASEAASAGCGLHLVHVVHPTRGPGGGQSGDSEEEREGQLALDAASERARGLVPAGVPVTSALHVGAVVPTLVDLAKEARMMVLGHRDLSGLRRVVTRSVSSGVAAHARVPTVTVPAGWSPARTDDRPPTVTVGLDVPDRGRQVLRTALDQARGRGATLRIVHTWHLPSPYEDLVVARSQDEEWRTRATAEIQAVLDGLGDQTAGVPVAIEVRAGRPADALVDAARDSDLLVVGRHDPVVPIGSHLGPVARAVLSEATCPVLVADPGRHQPVH
jgi:nucleotide-binding universal stress UspA family protein